MIENIKFKKVKCWFQRKLSSDIQTNIKKSSDLLLPADKTSTFYKMDNTAYNGLLQKKITKRYKKVPLNATSSINDRYQLLVWLYNFEPYETTLSQ